MREAEIADRDFRYKRPVPLSRSAILAVYGSLLALFVFLFLTKSQPVLFLFLIAFTSIINYQTNMTTIRFNPAPEVFFSLFLTHTLGLQYGLVMLLIPTLLIDIYTGRLDVDTFISLLFTVAINVIYAAFPLMSFAPYVIILIALKFVACLLIMLFLQISPAEIMFEHVLGFISNMITVMAFSDMLFFLFT